MFDFEKSNYDELHYKGGHQNERMELNEISHWMIQIGFWRSNVEYPKISQFRKCRRPGTERIFISFRIILLENKYSFNNFQKNCLRSAYIV